jgi:hypothetical protein
MLLSIRKVVQTTAFKSKIHTTPALDLRQITPTRLEKARVSSRRPFGFSDTNMTVAGRVTGLPVQSKKTA